MHRFVTAVATSPQTAPLDRVAERLGRRLHGWTAALASERVCAWVYSRSPTRLSHRRFGREGRLIGLDFNRNAHDIDQVFAETWGAFVAIGVDVAAQAVTVARDPTGRVECWRLSLDGVDLLFSHYADVYWLQPKRAAIDWRYLGHHLNQNFLHGAATGLDGVIEVLPGEVIRYRHDRRFSTLGWRPDAFAATPHDNPQAARRVMRSAAEKAVTHWADQYERITLDLSGGLDSTIVLGLLKGRRPEREVLGLTQVFEGAQGDERRFAQLAADRYGVSLIENWPKADEVEFKTPFSRKLLRPSPHVLSVDRDQAQSDLAKRQGSEAFFTGTGGDHLFYDHLPIAAAGDYLASGAPWSGLLDVALNMARVSGDTVWNVIGEALKSRWRPGADVRTVFPLENGFLSDEGRAAADFGRYTHPWVRDGLQTLPPAKLRQVASLVELRRHYLRFGRADVIEEVHPLFSQPVMEACLSVPSYWFALGGLQRGLARSAFADLLPPEIRERRSKGASTTFHIDFFAKALPKIRELLLGGVLAERGLLDRARMEAALTPLAVSASKDFPALICCLPTEIWVRQTMSDIASADAATADRVSA